MSIQYSGGTIVNYTFTDAGTRIDLVNNLNTQLKNAGWSVISGDGTSDVLMKTAVTPQGLSCRFRLVDPGSGNCAQFTMKNNAGTLTSMVGYLLPYSGQWRIWANKYWFAMFRTTTTYRTTPRGILFGGTLVNLPASVLTLLAGDLDVGWIQSMGTSDTDTSTSGKGTWRSNLGAFGSLNGTTSAFLWRSAIGSSNQTYPTIITPILWGYSAVAVPTWVDGQSSNMQGDALFAEQYLGVIGNISDACLMCKTLNGETDLFNFDGHTWMPITDASSLTIAVLNS